MSIEIFLVICMYNYLCILSHLGRATPSNFNYVNQQTDDESEPLLSDTSDINLQRHGYSGDFYVSDECTQYKEVCISWCKL